MRRIVVLVASACTFSPVQSDPTGTNPDAGPLKMPGMPGSNATCDVADDSLSLCLDFEDPSLEPIARDGSSLHDDAATAFVTPMPRGSEQAMHVSTRSAVLAAAGAQSNHTTVEMFVDPDAAPAGDEAFIYAASWDMGRYADGSVVADFAGATAGTMHPVAVGTWSHVAFTADGDTLRLYVNGDVVACQGMSGSQLQGGGGIAIGNGLDGTSPFVGGIDNVHVYARQLSSSELCGRAGRTNCKSSCPQ